MFICECGREFTKIQGLNYHKNYCGKYKIFIDNGYEAKIGLDGKIVYIHREVMEQKLGRKLLPGELVHHKDENKRNNDPDNLELTTRSDHGKTHFNLPIVNTNPAKGERVGTSKLTENQVIEIKHRLRNGEKYSNIHKDYGVHEDTIRWIKNGQRWKHITI